MDVYMYSTEMLERSSKIYIFIKISGKSLIFTVGSE